MWDDRVCRIRFKLHAVGVIVSHNIAGKFYNGKLHAKAEPEEGNIMSAGIFDGFDLAFDSSVTESAGNKDTTDVTEDFICIIRSNSLGIHPFDIYSCMTVYAAVLQSFNHTDVCVVKLDIFSNQSNSDFLSRMAQVVDHLCPVFQIWFRAVQMEAFAYDLSQMLLLHCERRLIKILHVKILKNMTCRQIAEQGNLIFHRCAQRIFGTAYDDVRLNSHSLKFLDAGLGRFRLHLLRCSQIRDQGNMDQDHIFPALFMLELADRLQERLAFDVADSPADFYDSDFCVFCSRIAVEAALDLVGDVRNDLNSASPKISPPFLLQDRPVDLSSGYVGILRQTFVNKSFIMPQIQIGLCSVVCDKYFSVLYRVHGSGIDVDIGIKFLHGDGISAGLQEPSKGCGGDPFPETGYYASCDEYIFYCHVLSSFVQDIFVLNRSF